MQIERKTIPEMSIQDFATEQGLVMEIHERRLPQGNPDRYYAHFKDCEIKDGGCLVGSFGNGATQPEAIENYARAISLKLIIVGANTPSRRNIEVPRLIIEGRSFP